MIRGIMRSIRRSISDTLGRLLSFRSSRCSPTFWNRWSSCIIVYNMFTAWASRGAWTLTSTSSLYLLGFSFAFLFVRGPSYKSRYGHFLGL
eukprot:UN13907